MSALVATNILVKFYSIQNRLYMLNNLCVYYTHFLLLFLNISKLFKDMELSIYSRNQRDFHIRSLVEHIQMLSKNVFCLIFFVLCKHS